MRTKIRPTHPSRFAAIRGQLLERRDLLTGDATPAPAVVFEYSLVSQASESDLEGFDRRTTLPASIEKTHEWDRFDLEIWVRGNSNETVFVDDLSLDLGYRTEFISAVDVQFGGSFREGTQSFEIEDGLGRVRQIHSEDANVALTNLDRVLFARVNFAPLQENNDNVRLDHETGSVGPHALNLSVENVSVASAGTTAAATHEALPQTELIPIIFDLNDDQKISLADFAQFVSVYGGRGDAPGEGLGWFADFNKDNKVTLGDLSLFVQNFGKSHLSEDIILPANYTEAWEISNNPSDTGDGGGPGGENETDPPTPVFVLDELQNFVPGMILGGANEVFFLMVGAFEFEHGIRIDRLSGHASMSGEGGEEPGDAILTIVLEDEEIYQTEIELVIDGELIDTLEEFSQYGGFISMYVAEVVDSLQGMLDDLLSGE